MTFDEWFEDIEAKGILEDKTHMTIGFIEEVRLLFKFAWEASRQNMTYKDI